MTTNTNGTIVGPIASQPITNLALICRYLTGSELIACYQTNRLLSTAASHPLTFQQETKVGVIADLSQCRSYANGPTAVFRTSQQMGKAFQSRLFKHFRVVHMNVTDESQLKDYIQILMQPNTPPLRAMTIKLPDTKFFYDDSRDEIELTLSDYSDAPALKYLTAVHLIDPYPDCTIRDQLIRFLPLSTEILHLNSSFSGMPLKSMQVLVDRLVKSNSQIKHLIVDSTTFTTVEHHLTELGRLHEKKQNIASLTIHWNVHIDCAWWDGYGLEELVELNLKLTQVATIQLEHVQLSSSYECCLSHVLPLFPGLLRLTINSMSMPVSDKMERRTRRNTSQSNSASISKSTTPLDVYPSWPTTLPKSLQSLRIAFDSTVSAKSNAPQFYCFILFLIQGKLFNLTHLELDVDSAVPAGGSLRELFESMPQLTRLSLNNITVDKLDDFAFAPNLISLYSLTWPSTLPNSLAHIFPSLQTLSVPYATQTTPTIHSELLKTAPNLRRLKWRRLPWIHPKDAGNEYAKVELERAKRIQAQAQADFKEREERLRLVQEKGVRAMASIDAIAPPTDELKNFFSRVNVATKIETAEEISARLRRQHLTPTKSTTVISTEPFVFTPPTNTNSTNDSTHVFASNQLTSPVFLFNSTHFSLTSPSATASTNSSTQPTPTSTLEPPNPFSLLTPQPSLSTSASVFNTPTSTSSMGVGGFSSSKKVGVGGRKSSGHSTTSVGHSSSTHSTTATTSPAFVFQANASTVDVSTIAPVNNPFAPPSFENSSSTAAVTAPSFNAAAFSFPIITPKQ